MEKDEIKKALECCTSDEKNACYKCPSINIKGYGGRDKLLANALELITEQEKEINLLQMQMEYVKNHADTFLAEANKFEAENKQLKAENKRILTKLADVLMCIKNTHDIDTIELVKQAKIDALNEVKAKSRLNAHIVAVLCMESIIDEMIEELNNGTN